MFPFPLQHSISQLRRENDLLKHQLKKYVSTVHTLQTQRLQQSEASGEGSVSPTHSAPPAAAAAVSEDSEALLEKLSQLANMQVRVGA